MVLLYVYKIKFGVYPFLLFYLKYKLFILLFKGYSNYDYIDVHSKSFIVP